METWGGINKWKRPMAIVQTAQQLRACSKCERHRRGNGWSRNLSKSAEGWLNLGLSTRQVVDSEGQYWALFSDRGERLVGWGMLPTRPISKWRYSSNIHKFSHSVLANMC